MTTSVPEPMDVAPPKVMEVTASGVPVGTLEMNVEFDYTLRFNQNIELQSTIEALKQYFRRAKKEKLHAIYLNTVQNETVVNSLHIFTERITD